jgi:hypothetical protein
MNRPGAETRTVPSISTAEAENFFTEGSPAWPAETRELEAHSNLSKLPATARGRAYMPGAVSPELAAYLDSTGMEPSDAPGTTAGLTLELSPREVVELREFSRNDEERDRLIAQLIFASRDLVAMFIREAVADLDEPARCLYCTAKARVARELVHESTCKAGRVAGVLSDLVNTAADSIGIPQARLAEAPAAIDLLCFACGERGGEWMRGDAAVGPAAITKGNQRVTGDNAGSGIYLYTHKCAVKTGGAQ